MAQNKTGNPGLQSLKYSVKLARSRSRSRKVVLMPVKSVVKRIPTKAQPTPVNLQEWQQVAGKKEGAYLTVGRYTIAVSKAGFKAISYIRPVTIAYLVR
jgi:hypothetical protein